MEEPISTVMVRKAVRRVLHSWTALKMAVDERMGGPDSLLYSYLLIDEILATVNPGNDELSVLDLADKLTDYMDQNLNVICEDGSPEEVATDLVKLFHLYKTQDVDGFSSLMNRLPNIPEWLPPDEVSLPVVNRTGLQDHTNASTSDEPMDIVPNTDEKVEYLVQDGWTKVLSKRKGNS